MSFCAFRECPKIVGSYLPHLLACAKRGNIAHRRLIILRFYSYLIDDKFSRSKEISFVVLWACISLGAWVGLSLVFDLFYLLSK